MINVHKYDKVFTQEGGDRLLPLDGDLGKPTIPRNLYFNTPPFNIKEILELSKFFELLPYDTSTTAATSYNVCPMAIALNKFPEITKFYAGIKADVIYSFHMQSHYQQVGALMPTYYGTGHENTGKYFGMNISGDDILYAYEQPNRLIPFGMNNTYDLRIPWSYQSSYQNLAISDRMGVLKILVIEPMRVATGVVPKATIQVWVALANVELVAYRNQY